MSDDNFRARPGEPLNIAADTWNALRDMLRRNNAVPSAAEHQGFDPLATNTGIVRVKNASGEDVPRFGVLAIEGPLFPFSTGSDVQKEAAKATFQKQVIVKGVKPTTNAHRLAFVVLLEPLKSNAIGRGYISGVCPAKVNVTDASHTYADPKLGDATQLASAAGGSAKILWKETGTGENKLAIVSLQSAGPEFVFVRVMSPVTGTTEVYNVRILSGQFDIPGNANSGHTAMPAGMADPGSDNAIGFSSFRTAGTSGYHGLTRFGEQPYMYAWRTGAESAISPGVTKPLVMLERMWMPTPTAKWQFYTPLDDTLRPTWTSARFGAS